MSYSVSDPIKSHVYCYRYFSFAVPFTILFDIELSVATIVAGCWWPISARTVLVAVSFWQFFNNPPKYYSVAGDMTFLVVMYSTCNGPF